VPSAEVRWEIAYESLAALEESQAWKNWPAVKAFGLDGFRFHDLRHTCAAMLIQQGAHPRAIMEGSEPLNEAEYIVVTNADLTGADLDGANLKGATADQDTTWPEGFDPQAAGVTFEG